MLWSFSFLRFAYRAHETFRRIQKLSTASGELGERERWTTKHLNKNGLLPTVWLCFPTIVVVLILQILLDYERDTTELSLEGPVEAGNEEEEQEEGSHLGDPEMNRT